MIAFDMNGPSENNIIAYLLLIFLFSSACIWEGYAISFFFDSIEVVQEWVTEFVNMSLFILWLVVAFSMEEPSVAVQNLFSINPGFALYRAFSLLEHAPEEEGSFGFSDIFDWDRELIQIFLILFFDSIVFASMVAFLHSNWQSAIYDMVTQPSISVPRASSFSGSKKVSGIKKGTNNTTNFIHAENVNKEFLDDGRVFKAVNEVSLGVEKGCLFGLLGPNGAGKTTLIKCMTGTEPMTSGNAWINEYSMREDLSAAQKQMGVCPQFDALLPLLTAREHLQMFARIRGVPHDQLEQVVSGILGALQLDEKADCVTKDYSGGNKRKLSVALSMVAGSFGVFLDEPSTGMDPSTRRFLWDFLRKERGQRAMILTTHSMEEADALCNRIGIMIKGSLRTIGSSQELKTKHGSEYLVRIRLKDNLTNGDKVTEKLKALSTGTELDTQPDQDVGLRCYKLPQRDCTIVQIFTLILKNQDNLGIIDFTVSQCSLEDVFLNFVGDDYESQYG